MSQDSTQLVSPSELEALHYQSTLLAKRNHQRGGSLRIGQQHSINRGAGLELEDLRNYQAGDDVRHIAWRASARQSNPLCKVFQAEQQERRLVCIEHHAGMCFGTEKELKAGRAIKLAAALCFSALSRGAEVATLLASSKLQLWPFSHRLDDSFEFLRQANQVPFSPAPIAQPTALLKQLQHISQRHSQICIISDFFHWQEKDFNTLASLNAKHSVLGLHVVDPGELKLNQESILRLLDSHSAKPSTINTRLPGLQQAYEDRMQQKLQGVRRQLQQTGSDYIYSDGEQALLGLLEDKL